MCALGLGVFTAWSDEPLTITHLARTPDGLTLGWNSVGTNLAYTVHAREALGPWLWLLPQTTNPWPVSGTQWTDVTALSNASRFYRVVAVPAAQRGKRLSHRLGQTLSTWQIYLYFLAAGIPVTPQYNVRLYEMTYETVDAWGARTVASGAVVLPTGVGRALPLFSYQHGTITKTNEAPSSLNLESEVLVGVVMATSGYAAVLADYLGLGRSPWPNPYHHARSEATACLDALRAARALCASNSVPLNGQLFLAGYSQGGHATLALHRELESYHTNEFTITASAPMAGAYDLSGVTAADILSGRLPPNPYYFAYLLAAYQSVYALARSLADWLVPPYQTTLPPLLAGNATGDQINAAMPADPLAILRPELLAELRTNANNRLRQALRDNDVYAWTPRRPLRLYHCAGDKDVIFANSQLALAHFHNRGATHVQLIDPQPSADHGGCVQPAFLQVKTWFDSLKQ